MCCVCECYKGYKLLLPIMARCLETIDVCIWRMFLLASTLCKYDLRKGALSVLSWERLQRARGKYLFTAANVWFLYVM